MDGWIRHGEGGKGEGEEVGFLIKANKIIS